ncbi:hypothetical protein N665_0380s0017 [Sinapis alba]|nr:hypothetical protein N665_0380s0017 [Sinapis alba]
MVGYTALLLNVVAFLFSLDLVRSNQINSSPRSFKISENVTFDCVDIYKQPSLSHPLLRTHKIQMKPSVSRPESNYKAENRDNNKKIRCPDGTIPILRTTKEYASNARRFEEMHLNPLSADSPGTHIAGVRSTSAGPYHGVQGWFTVFELNVAKDQASYASIYLGTETNFIQAGWMINPGVFGDQRVWSYGFWRGKNGKGCYNVNCPGFVQVAKDDPIGYPNEPSPYVGSYRFSIHQDKHTGNWWITELIKGKPNVDIGYWPKELFDLLSDGAKMVGVGGTVQASPSGSSPPMGNGQLPSKNPKSSAIFTNVGFLNSHYVQSRFDSAPTDKILDSGKCYGLRYGDYMYTDLQFNFNYGGPGGNSCGV